MEVIQPIRKAQAEKDRIAREEARREQEAREAAQRAYQADLDATAALMKPTGTYANNYAPLNCTQYVASRVRVPPYLGNATQWSWGLRNAGWREGGPRVGAIGVSHAGWAGHVVLAVRAKGQIEIEEQNYMGLGVISRRWVNPGEFEWFYQ